MIFKIRQIFHRPAFTIVELLVVITIISLLISFILPSLSQAKNQATKVKCLSNIRQTLVALLAYHADNHDLVYNFDKRITVHDEVLSNDYTKAYRLPSGATHAHWATEALDGKPFWESYLLDNGYSTSPDGLGCAFSVWQGWTAYPYGYNIDAPGVSVQFPTAGSAAQLRKAPPFIYRGPSAADDANLAAYTGGQIAYQGTTDSAFNGRSAAYYPHGKDIDGGHKAKPLLNCPEWAVGPFDGHDNYLAPHVGQKSFRNRLGPNMSSAGTMTNCYLGMSIGWSDGRAGLYEQPAVSGNWWVNYDGEITQSLLSKF